MKKNITIISRGAVLLMGTAVVVVCGVLFPELGREEAIANPKAGPLIPYFIGLWILSIPIFIGLYQTWRLLDYIDKNNAFSAKSIKALQIIKMCAITFAILIILSAVAVVVAARATNPTEDVAPVGPIGFVFVSVSVIIATFVAVLQRVLKNGIDIKSENDLTV